METKWKVLICGLILRIPECSVLYSLGRYLVEFNHGFLGTNDTFLNWMIILPMFSLYMYYYPVLNVIKFTNYMTAVIVGGIVMALGLVLASLSYNQYQLLISLGVMFGVGIALLDATITYMVLDFFPVNDPCHITVNSLIISANPIGTFIGPASVELMLHYKTWPWCLRVQALAICLLSLTLGVTYVRTFKDSVTYKEHSTTNNEQIPRVHKVISILWGTSWTLKGLAIYFSHFLLINHAVNLKLTKEQGTVCVTILGAIEIVSRVVTCCLGDRYLKGRLLNIFIACILGLMLTSILGYFCSTFALLTVYSAFCGLFSGPIISANVSASGELLAGKYMRALVALIGFSGGVGLIMGFLINGLVLEIHGSYKPLFILHSCFYFISAVLIYSAKQLSLSSWMF